MDYTTLAVLISAATSPADADRELKAVPLLLLLLRSVQVSMANRQDSAVFVSPSHANPSIARFVHPSASSIVASTQNRQHHCSIKRVFRPAEEHALTA
jgi:hypothetical protein